ncbi:MAG: trypsin-like serine protease [Mycobacteriales bacterium]
MVRKRKYAGLLAVVAAGVVAAVLAALAAAPGAQAVAHGTPVPEGQFRFATKLTMTNIPRPDGTHYNSACSAALVAPMWIITAGHCFHDVNRVRVSGPTPYATTATVGRTDLSDTTGAVVDVVWVEQAPNGADFALGKLAQPVLGVAPLMVANRPPAAGDVLRLTGWGATSSDNPTPVNHLQTGQVQVSSVTASTIGVHGYAPSADTSACLYDSGAPYFVERPVPHLVSVESNGPDCPHPLEETTARVDNQFTWIIQRITAGPTQ